MTVVAADVADRSSLAAVLARCRREAAGPIRGVFHCAGVVEDRIDQDSRIGRASSVCCGRKCWGRGCCTNCFRPTRSSGSCCSPRWVPGWGRPGRPAMPPPTRVSTRWPRCDAPRGAPPCRSIGAPGRLGFARTSGGQRTVRALEAAGFGSFSDETGCAALGRLLDAGVSQMSVVPIDPFRLARSDWADRPIFAAQVATARRTASADAAGLTVAAELATAAPERRVHLVELEIRRQLASGPRLPNRAH